MSEQFQPVPPSALADNPAAHNISICQVTARLAPGDVGVLPSFSLGP